MSKRNDTAAAVAAAQERFDELERKRNGYAAELGRLQRELTPAGYDSVDELEAAFRSKTARQAALTATISRLDVDIADAGAELQRARADLARERYAAHIKALRHELEAAVDALDGAAGAFARAAAAGHDATAQERIFDNPHAFNAFAPINTVAGEMSQTAERWRRWLDARIASNEYWR